MSSLTSHRFGITVQGEAQAALLLKQLQVTCLACSTCRCVNVSCAACSVFTKCYESCGRPPHFTSGAAVGDVPPPRPGGAWGAGLPVHDEGLGAGARPGACRLPAARGRQGARAARRPSSQCYFGAPLVVQSVARRGPRYSFHFNSCTANE